ncbi:alpha/beta fold hydrolase [Microbacterium sp.]|uniref:alpha/beta fold hydrolase n=1 Tax=Microbacterium sp. TaxID=51671 RepID=UPI003A92F726
MYPPIEPHAHGWVHRPDGAEIFWEESGAPGGRPALYLHGGPGGGLGRGGYRRRFDPAVYRTIGIDQRGCGRSRPLATDDLAHLDGNTTAALIADIEAVREHLGVERWLVHGVSWGSTLALAYALAHPDHVAEVIVAAVTTTSREEVEWITETVGAVFPEAWERFAAVRRTGERVVDAYARLLRDPDPQVRARAADEWDAWEATHVSLDPLHSTFTPGQRQPGPVQPAPLQPAPLQPAPLHEDATARAVFATLVTHYWAHDGFLTGADRILNRVGELAGIPGVLIHGRHDVSGPAITAWRLHRAWPGSRLHIVETEGHGGPEMMELVAQAADAFAR